MNKTTSIKRWKKYLAIIVAVMLMVTWMPMRAQAATANVSIALSTSSLEVGETVTVTVTVKCNEAIGSYAMAVVYDSSVMEYVSGSGNGGGGTVNIAGYGDGAATTLQASLTFKAVGTGSTSVSTTGGEAYTWNEESMELAHAGARIEVGGGDEASTDNNLASLSVSPGTLSPAFSASTTGYKVTVNADTKDLIVSAKANDAKASVSVSGNKGLKTGDNTVTITVTAESGDKKVYQIICTKPAGSTEDTEESEDTDTSEETSDGEEDTEEATDTAEEEDNRCYVLIEGVQYYFATEEDEVEIPADFGMTTLTYQKQKVMAFVGPKEAVALVCLYNPEGEQVWFIYEEETGGFLAFQEVTGKKLRLFIMKPSDDIEIPEGYRSVDVELKGSIITGFMNEANSDILLVYGRKANGDAGWYYYDSIENTFIRYFEVQREAFVSAPVEEEDNDSDVTDLSKRIPLSYDQLFWVAVAIAAMVLILLIVCIVQAVKLKKNYVDPDTKAMMEYAATQKQGGDKSPKQSTDKTRNVSKEERNKENKKQDLEDKAAQVVAKMDFEEVPTIQFTAITSRKKSEESEEVVQIQPVKEESSEEEQD